MRQEQFTLENLRLLDFGKIGAAFNAELERVVKDCMDRPRDDNARKVSITFNLTPEADPTAIEADCEAVTVECEITSAVPKRRTKIYRMSPRQDGTLAFHPDIPEEPDGSTLYDADTGEVVNKNNRKGGPNGK